MKQVLFALYFVLSVTSVSAHLAPLSPAGESLQRELLTGIRSLDRGVQLIHYFRAPTDGSYPPQLHSFLQNKTNREGWLNYFFSFRMGAFWDPNNHVTEMTASGPGMYFAIDPSVSREFGESAVVLNLPAGMKYLSLAKGISVSKETRELLVKENIVSKDQLGTGETKLGLSRAFSADTLKNFVREEHIAFRNLVTDIFDRNQIVLVEYSWKSHLAGFCQKDSQSAFVLIGLKPQPIESDNDKSTEASEILAGIPDGVRSNFFFFSDLNTEDLTSTELREKDLLGRYRHVLLRIKEKGISKAKDYIEQILNDEEVEELADRTYRCERRY